MHNYRLPSSDGGLYGVSSQIMTIGINYGRYMVTIFYWAARLRATLNQEIPLVHIEKRPNAGRNF